jgi:hypothetical protein
VEGHEFGERIDATRGLDLDRHGLLLRACPRPCTLYGPESRRFGETVPSRGPFPVARHRRTAALDSGALSRKRLLGILFIPDG